MARWRMRSSGRKSERRASDASAFQAAVSTRFFGEILLMILFGIVESRGSANFSGDGAKTARAQSLLIGITRRQRDLHVRSRIRINSRTILSTYVVSLAHALGRIVRL